MVFKAAEQVGKPGHEDIGLRLMIGGKRGNAGRFHFTMKDEEIC